MWPVGTPLNVIVLGTGKATIAQMAYGGFALNIVCGPAHPNLAFWSCADGHGRDKATPMLPHHPITVAALYHFARLPDPQARQGPLLDLCRAQGLCGTLLLAPEGVNGTIAGPRAGILTVLDHIRAWPSFDRLVWKESAAGAPPFARMKVRLKYEIVTMGQPDMDPATTTGHYVAPADWNALIAAPDVAVIDTRNDYEVQIGTFRGAIDPGTKSFRDFPAWWAANADRFRGKRIAMFCTGGIRCEKSTNYLISQGVDQVYHLQGGILKYLEEVSKDDSAWQGECFVFDQRVSLTHGLAQGRHGLCRACRRPLAPEDRAHPDHEDGVSCHRCAEEYTDADRSRFRDRQRQFDRGHDTAGVVAELAI